VGATWDWEGDGVGGVSGLGGLATLGGDVGLHGHDAAGEDDGPYAGCHTGSGAAVRQRRGRVQTTVTQLSSASNSSFSEYETDVEDNAEDETLDVNGVKYFYRNETWSKNNFTYDPPCMTFSGRKGTT
jgi:hypothetical protein